MHVQIVNDHDVRRLKFETQKIRREMPTQVKPRDDVRDLKQGGNNSTTAAFTESGSGGRG